MTMTRIEARQLRNMENHEGLVIQGCGGELREWVDGINEMLTEADILQEVLEATKGKLLIFVTHRLSFARQADQILYLKNGMIAEHGTHEELMEKGGDYCRMFTTQRRQYFAQEGENDAV